MNAMEPLQAERVHARQQHLKREAEQRRDLIITRPPEELTNPTGASFLMRFRFQVTLVTLCILLTLLIFAVPARAQGIDLGNDGIDWNCDGFPERKAAEGYFAHDGGSVDRNVDNLDPDGDGVPCNEVLEDSGDDVQGRGNDNAEIDPVPVTTFPDTGTGRASAVGKAAGSSVLVVVIAMIGGAVALDWRRRSID